MSRSLLRFPAIACVLLGLASPAIWPAEMLRPAGRAAANQDVQFQVFLPLQHVDELDQLLVAQQTPGSTNYHKWLTPAEFRARFGARQEDINRATEVLEAYGLRVTNTFSQGLQVEGRVGDVESAFSVGLVRGVTANGATKLMTTESLSMPQALKSIGATMASFFPIPAHQVHARITGRIAVDPNNRYSDLGPYWFTDLKQAYNWPSYQALTGKGRKIGIVMWSDFLDDDIKAYFAHEKLKAPKVERRPVLGGAPFDPNSGGSFEVELDIQQSGGMAPGATILVYNVPAPFDDAVVAGYVNLIEANEVDIVNSSFGIQEALYTAPYNGGVDQTGILRTYDSLFKQGNAQGITFVTSSGDHAGVGLPPVNYFTDDPQGAIVGSYRPGIESPASSPHVTAVGGTNLATTANSPSLQSKYTGENSYGDPLLPDDPYGIGNYIEGGFWGSGSGTSILFAKPSYQQLVSINSRKRSIPDLSLHMGGCPVGAVEPCGSARSADVLFFDGGLFGVIGTSASSPDFAGLLALKEEYLGGKRLGNINFEIYALAAAQAHGSQIKYYRQGIPGFNGVVHSHPNTTGYDQITGNGSVIGKNFILAPQLPPAGDPQTPSNP